MATIIDNPPRHSEQAAVRFVLEHVTCDLCGCRDYDVRYRKPDNWLWLTPYQYPVVRCSACGLTYVNPRPTFESNSIFYPKGYHENRNDERHRKRYEHQFSYIEGFEARRILDVGCARGDWLNFVKTKRPQVELHGVDAFSDGVNGSDISFYNCALPEADVRENYFDLVTSWAVFEHLHTPRRYFETVARVLRPGGRFVFLVTNAESCYGRYAYSEDVPRHLYHFSERTLAMYAAKCGLEVEGTYFDDRLWDGRGHGTFAFAFGKFAGVDWDDHYFKRLNLLQRTAMKAGRVIDKIVFSTHWEARLRRSGIIIAVMSK